jgi:predicted RND superfamily exporter protein
MKSLFAILAVVMALAASPVLAADKEKGYRSVEERLKQAELSVAIKQYKKVVLLQQETALQIALIETGASPVGEKEVKVLTKRLELLAKQADSLRQMAMDCDATIQKHREVAAAAK